MAIFKQHKNYRKPSKPFDQARIKEERVIVEKYGLKNKREIWKAEAFLSKIIGQTKKLIVKPEEQEHFFEKLDKLGLIKGKPSIDDILALTKEKVLDRRLQTVVFKKKHANTIKQSRQLIVHRKIKVGERVVNIPGYLVKAEEESKISLLK